MKKLLLLLVVLLFTTSAEAGPWQWHVFLHDGKITAARPCTNPSWNGPVGMPAPTDPIVVYSESALATVLYVPLSSYQRVVQLDFDDNTKSPAMLVTTREPIPAQINYGAVITLERFDLLYEKTGKRDAAFIFRAPFSYKVQIPIKIVERYGKLGQAPYEQK